MLFLIVIKRLLLNINNLLIDDNFLKQGIFSVFYVSSNMSILVLFVLVVVLGNTGIVQGLSFGNISLLSYSKVFNVVVKLVESKVSVIVEVSVDSSKIDKVSLRLRVIYIFCI